MSEKFPIPSKRFSAAHINGSRYEELYHRSINEPEEFWGEMAAEFIDWHKPWDKVLEHSFTEGKIAWFLGGKLNASYNCIDRHAKIDPDRTAIIWEGNEPGDVRKVTYSELLRETCKIANALKKLGVKKGDRVALYMPMVPELAFAMLACARIGAVHSVIFAGFSASSIKNRILDFQAKVLITGNVGLRASKVIELKKIADQALSEVDCIEQVLVYKRAEAPTAMTEGRDIWLHDAVEGVPDWCEPEIVDAEDPLYILYTSGSTGKPKGALHTTGGYLLFAAMTHKFVFDYKPGDIYFCAADLGWVTGHSYIVYGPLANGATTLMFESIPTYPNAGRYWDVIERHKVNIFYTAPTAIRTVAKEGDQFVDNFDLSSLRVLGSVGEPINRDAWLWYYKRIGKEKAAVVDTWWQTETGGILISALPGAHEVKPGSAVRPFFGIRPVIVDESGKELTGNGVSGRLCIGFPWPGQMRTVYGDHQRFIDTYFRDVPGMYLTGDACARDEDGYYWIAGRVDDVLNVSGHRLGTAEIESAIVQSGIIAEAAVVGREHEIKGTTVCAFCVLKDGHQGAADEAHASINSAVRQAIGGLAVPEYIYFVPGLPKTRSGKILRRILRKLANGERQELGDTTTLAEPDVVEEIIRVM